LTSPGKKDHLHSFRPNLWAGLVYCIIFFPCRTFSTFSDFVHVNKCPKMLIKLLLLVQFLSLTPSTQANTLFEFVLGRTPEIAQVHSLSLSLLSLLFLLHDTHSFRRSPHSLSSTPLAGNVRRTLPKNKTSLAQSRRSSPAPRRLYLGHFGCLTPCLWSCRRARVSCPRP